MPQDFRTYVEFDNHEMVVSLTDETVGLVGYVGIHSTALGPALGGTRLQTYDSPDDALHDALNLSQAMSYKCALAGLPYGGGKGVIYLPKDTLSDHRAILAAYAKAIENLRGLFKTGTDVGVTDEDVQYMAQYTTHMLGVTPAGRGNLTTASCAALGVFYAIQATLQAQFGDSSVEGHTVAIKGVGKLGSELARLIIEAGGRVTIADVHEGAVQKTLHKVPGATVVSVDDIHKQQVDVYAPCALGNELNVQQITELRCQVICGGANNQLASADIADKLHDKGILYIPDYVANGGGLIYVADELEPGGFKQERVLKRIESIGFTVYDMVERSREEHRPPSVIADAIGRERMQATVT
jgi:glutamate dehydrogenase/leucine dehydrogenase